MAGLFHTGVWLCLLASLVGLFDFVGWPLELPAHFRPHCIVVLLAGCILHGLARAWWRLGAKAIVLGLLAYTVLASAPRAERASGASQSITVCSFNVLTSNRSTGPVLDFLRSNNFDVVFLMEVDDRWLAALETLRDLYPFIHADARGDNFGVALLTRTKPGEVSIIEHGSHKLPTVRARVHGIQMVGTHTAPPISAYCTTYRDDQLATLARGPAGETNTLVIGDFNCAPWTTPFKKFAKASGKLDARPNAFQAGTWPASAPSWSRIPIDHALVSPDLRVSDFRTGPELGSDHLPIIIELAPPKAFH